MRSPKVTLPNRGGDPLGTPLGGGCSPPIARSGVRGCHKDARPPPDAHGGDTTLARYTWQRTTQMGNMERWYGGRKGPFGPEL